MPAIGVDVVVVEDVVVVVEPGVGHAEDMALSFPVTFVLGTGQFRTTVNRLSVMVGLTSHMWRQGATHTEQGATSY